MTIGVLPSQTLLSMIDQGQITGTAPLVPSQIQPASLDLRLGHRAYRVRASFLAGQNRSVLDRLSDFQMHQIDLTNGAVLEKGCVYLVPLQESLALPDDIHGAANAKSSTGRLDLLTRTITDGGVEFDRIPAGYHGPLYAEICPRSFSVLVRPGMTLNQLRLRNGAAQLDDAALRDVHRQTPLVDHPPLIQDGLGFSVDLEPRQNG
ncbi:MAG: 2'-deoxycytidine 5'-triphosphate deaminase, partial [Pseudomonadota bacterium]